MERTNAERVAETVIADQLRRVNYNGDEVMCALGIIAALADHDPPIVLTYLRKVAPR